MTKALSAAEVAAYRERGIHFPIRAIPAVEANALAAQFQASPEPIKGRVNQKPHLLFPWLNELVRDPRIVDAVEDVLGPDIWCWGSQFFAKRAGDPAYTSWHQDGTYWGLSSQDVVTAWVALTPSTRESGCMQVVPGTHHEQVPHEDKFDEKNMLSRGQEIAVTVDPASVVDVELGAGRDVAPSRPPVPRLRAEPRRPSAYRFCDPLCRDPCPPALADPRERDAWCAGPTPTAISSPNGRRRATCIRTLSRGTTRSSIVSCASSTKARSSAASSARPTRHRARTL